MRATFSHAIVAAAKSDPRVLLLTGDHGYALFDDFRRAAPAQFINAGVAEQNMVGVAAGLAKAGFKPIVYGLSAFVPVRVLEQIKLDVCYEQLPVVFIGDGAGVVYSSLGGSHQSLEDIAALRALPHIDILSPADAYEMAFAMAHALQSTRPVYVRMGKADLGNVHDKPITAPIGDLLPLRAGRPGSAAIVATGSMARTALALSETIPGAGVWSAPSIAPINYTQVETIARSVNTLIVLEEHSSIAGLGGLVAEIVGEMMDGRCRVIRLGVDSRFSQYCGTYQYLLKEHRIDVESLRARLVEKGVTCG
ncbi:transketolase family protein [Trinickia fusca]|uniref:Transketolase n=1 Tax=Trinickia fusca TaxID=2419777 RepID=A0A494XM85_9BURK|nr:transketolase C-terminal domain-containing protein [Trinickia fusca]RKP50861.1 transketolase [Trinickia fusca]